MIRRVLTLTLLAAIAAVVVGSVPDIKRYLEMRRM